MTQENIQEPGANDGQQQGSEGSSYTKEDVDKLIEQAKKEAETGVYRKFQSEKDKEISEIRKAAEKDKQTLQEKLSEYERQRLEQMTPEEKTQYMIQQLYEREHGSGAKPSGEDASSGKSDASPSTGTPEPQGNDDQAAQVRETVGSVLKEMGYDPQKVDWAEGERDPQKAMARWVKSILDQKPQPSGDSSGEDDSESNRVSTSRGAGPANDITKVDPYELAKEGYKEKSRFRGNTP